MESVVSLADLKREFKEMIGFRASAPITEEGALRSAGIIVEVEGKFVRRQDLPPDLFRVIIATSQLLQWCDQENKAVSSGEKMESGNPRLKKEIMEKFRSGARDEQEIKELTQKLYVADPLLGASKAMELLKNLHSRHPEVPLKQDLND